MDTETLKKELVRDEGVVLHAYQDHLGYWTLGVGRLIDERRGGGITHDEAMYLLGNDIARVEQELSRRLDWWDGLDDSRQRALCNMAFQLGVNGLMQFKNMLDALSQAQWDRAKAEALNSLWARQTPNRAARVANMLVYGDRV